MTSLGILSFASSDDALQLLCGWLRTERQRLRWTQERLRVHPSSPSHDIADANALFDAGEITPLDYLVIREELLDGELAEIAWRRDLRLAEKRPLRGWT